MNQIVLLTLISLAFPAFATNRNANATASATSVPQSADAGSAAADEKTASAARFGLLPASTASSKAGIPNDLVDAEPDTQQAAAAKQKAAQASIQTIWAQTLFQSTAAYENYTVLQYMIDRGIDVRAPIMMNGIAKELPLVLATQNGAVFSVATLLDAGAPCNLATSDKPSPLAEAVHRSRDNSNICSTPMDKNKLIIKMLIHAGANTTAEALGVVADDYERFVAPALLEVEQEKVQDQKREAAARRALSECQSDAFPAPVANIVVQYTQGKNFMEYATEQIRAAVAKIPAFAASASATAVASHPTAAANEKSAAADEKVTSAARFDMLGAQTPATNHPEGAEYDAKRAEQLFCDVFYLMSRGYSETACWRVRGPNGIIQAVPMHALEHALNAYRKKITWDSLNGNIRIGEQTVDLDNGKSPLDTAIYAVAPLCVGLLLDAGAPPRLGAIGQYPTTSEPAILSWRNSLKDGRPTPLTKPAEVILRMLLRAGARRHFVFNNWTIVKKTDYDAVAVPAIAQVEREVRAWETSATPARKELRRALIRSELSNHALEFAPPLLAIVLDYDVPVPQFSYLEYAQDALGIPREQ